MVVRENGSHLPFVGAFARDRCLRGAGNRSASRERWRVPVRCSPRRSAGRRPFLGGVLVPDLMLLLPLPTDAAGAVDFQVTVPGGLPVGLPLRFQHWIEDPAVSFGYSASNGVLGILQ
jgi:hypothetical protein